MSLPKPDENTLKVGSASGGGGSTTSSPGSQSSPRLQLPSPIITKRTRTAST